MFFSKIFLFKSHQNLNSVSAFFMYFVNHFQKTQVKQTNVCFILLLFERAIDLLDVAVDLVDVALERGEVALERVEVALDLVDVALDLVNVALDWCGTKMCRKCVTVVESL